MKKNKTTIAEEHKKIYNRFYTNTKRKPGEDRFTDEAYNMAAKRLMEYQESIKPKEDPQQQMPQQANGGYLDNWKNGGGLPKYKWQDDQNGYAGFLNLENQQDYKYEDAVPNFDPNENLYANRSYRFRTGMSDTSQNGMDLQSRGYSAALNNTTNPKLGGIEYNNSPAPFLVAPGVKYVDASGKALGKQVSGDGMPSGSQFSPVANILGPALSIGANAISSHILARNAEKRNKDLLKNINVNLGRVQANQIDLGRERSNIRSNEALTESTGRYIAKGARSASEAARIVLMARLGGSRTAGDQLGQSYQKEEMVNADYRTRADETNRQLSAQEAMMKQQQTNDIEQRYGDAPAQIRAGFAQSTGQTIQNYMAENQRMKRDNNYLNMLNPNYELDYQQDYNKTGDMDQLLYRLGIKTLNPTKRVR